MSNGCFHPKIFLFRRELPRFTAAGSTRTEAPKKF